MDEPNNVQISPVMSDDEEAHPDPANVEITEEKPENYSSDTNCLEEVNRQRDS